MSQESRLIKITCTCCGAKIDVDPETRKIFAIKKKGMKKRSFEEVVQEVTSVGERAEAKFKANLEREKNREKELDRIFEDASKKAAKEPNVKPPSIWDYD